jgi:hypothetical protein
MPTTPPSITALPTAPDPNDRSTFNARAYPWSAALTTWTTQVSAVAANVKANADEAEADATTASTAAGNAASSATLAQDWASKASTPVSGGVYSAKYYAELAQTVVATIPNGTINDGTTSGTSVWSSSKVSTELGGKQNTLVSGTSIKTINSTSLLGSGDVAVQPTLVSGTNIKTVGGQSILGSGDLTVGGIPNIVRSARTSNTILGAADKGTLIDITSGTFTQTFTAAATLANGWWCYIRNAGTGDITLDPNASETIDGLTSYVMYPGEVRLVQCDGSAFFSVVLSAFNKEFSASGTFTKPPGYQLFDGFAWGAGGGGSKYAANGAGGGGGACAPFTLRASVVPPSVSVTIGAGGTGKSGADGNGLTGGNTTFGSLLTAYGGSGGESGQGGSGGGVLSAASGGTPGQPYTSGSLRENPGFGGAAPNGYDSAYGGAAGSSSAGGRAYAGGGGGGGYTGAAGGLSVLGGSGGAGSSSGTAVAGTAPAGGGGGTSTGTGGNGARGELRIWGVI